MATLDLYRDLAHDTTTTRLNAVHALLQSLRTSQTQFEAVQKPAASAAGKQGKGKKTAESSESTANSALNPNLQYALTRLVRGLSSSNPSARQGFALALTQVLCLFSLIQTRFCAC
jgi:DNA polymerase phi